VFSLWSIDVVARLAFILMARVIAGLFDLFRNRAELTVYAGGAVPGYRFRIRRPNITACLPKGSQRPEKYRLPIGVLRMRESLSL
jgi:hypothetical protein